MGSRMMHVIIANRIAECLSIDDRTAYLLGSIAPDAVSTKNESHFFIGDVRDYSRAIDYKGFIYKYSPQVESHYILGYFTHLIADDIWLKGFNLPWLRNRIEANKELADLYHNDFQLLNGKLLEYYGFTDELRILFNCFNGVVDLQEVCASDVEHFVPHVRGLSSILDCDNDKVMVLKDGEMAAYDTHENLRNRNETYNLLFQNQYS